MRIASKEFWTGKRVLITGHTGFKGSWLSHWLLRLGAEVTGIGLPPKTHPSLYTLLQLDEHIDSALIDIRNLQALSKFICAKDPEIVFHLAAQPLVLESYRQPQETFSVNVQGTVNVLECLRCLKSIRAAVLITTDKVYKNNNQVHPYRETDTLGGHDPYSASKAACELVIDSYRSSFFQINGPNMASVRAGNIIGGGDWSQDRLIPDAIRAWSNGRELEIRHPNSVRPWQHVLEPLNAYLVLAQHLWVSDALSGAFNFGPPPQSRATVMELLTLGKDFFPYHGTKVLPSDGKHVHEAGLLSLDSSKAAAMAGLRSKWSLTKSVQRTLSWYLQFSMGRSALSLCDQDIDEYLND